MPAAKAMIPPKQSELGSRASVMLADVIGSLQQT
jgi:hypothetical protein